MGFSLSVVVIVLGSRESLTRCLKALEPQVSDGCVEVVVPVTGDIPGIRDAFPWARFLKVTGRRTYAELRSLGIRESTGKLVAITEDHCIPRSDWCRQIIAEHAVSGDAAIGGAVEKHTPDSALNWSFYFADYVRYMSPLDGGPAQHLTDCNVTYKRSALNEVSGVWAKEFHENVVHEAFRERGRSLRASGRIVVDQQRSLTFGGAMWDRYAFGRLFASTRVREGELVPRLVFAATAPLLPALLVWRAFGHVRRKGRHMAQFVRAFPHLLLICSLWALGEFAGYVSNRPEKTLAVSSSSHAEA